MTWDGVGSPAMRARRVKRRQEISHARLFSRPPNRFENRNRGCRRCWLGIDLLSTSSDLFVPTNRTILVVEDEALIIMLLEAAFADEGYNVITASNAAQAMGLLETNPVDGVVTDIRMPGAGDGWSVGQRARELTPNLPVVYMTGDSGADWEAKGVPGSVVFNKPMRTETLIEAMASLLH